MSDDLQQQILQHYQDKYDLQQAQQALQQAKLEALQQILGNHGDYKYFNFNNLIDPDNKNWTDYTYNTYRRGNNAKRQIHIDFGTPEAQFINNIRNAKTIDDIKKQYELWDLYKPLDTPSGARDYVRYITTGGYQGSNAPYGGSRPIFPTTDESEPVQTTTTTTGGTQGIQTGTQTGNAVVRGGTQGTQTGNGTYASSGVAKGGIKTIGYDPNPGNVSLAYAMRNAPEQERRAALIDKWNQEHGRSSSTYASPSISTGGTYATGQGIKDANGNVLTNPGGDWEYQYALKDPQYGLGMMGKMSDAQKNYLQAVSDNMGYKYNFTGATRFV